MTCNLSGSARVNASESRLMGRKSRARLCMAGGSRFSAQYSSGDPRSETLAGLQLDGHTDIGRELSARQAPCSPSSTQCCCGRFRSPRAIGSFGLATTAQPAAPSASLRSGCVAGSSEPRASKRSAVYSTEDVTDTTGDHPGVGAPGVLHAEDSSIYGASPRP